MRPKDNPNPKKLSWFTFSYTFQQFELPIQIYETPVFYIVVMNLWIYKNPNNPYNVNNIILKSALFKYLYRRFIFMQTCREWMVNNL